MQRLLGDDLWAVLSAQARKARSRRAAIAYATVDHIGFRKGDQLVVDASDLAIRCGETSAKLLQVMHRRGVELYSRPGLHAKIALLDDLAFVGSANLSASSADHLDEAGLLTDHAGTVAAVQVMLSQWIDGSERLTAARVAELVKLPVAPRRGPSMLGGKRARKRSASGDRVWIVGVRELRADAHPAEQDAVRKGERKAEQLRSHERSDLSWIRWAAKRGFGVDCLPGDVVFQVHKALDRKRLYVLKPSTVLLVEPEPTCRRIHLEEFPGRMADEMTLRQFQRQLATIDIKRGVGQRSSRVLPVGIDVAVKAWKSWKA